MFNWGHLSMIYKFLGVVFVKYFFALFDKNGTSGFINLCGCSLVLDKSDPVDNRNTLS